MGTALVNTLLGMGVVFVVLIFISMIISLFQYIPQLFGAETKKGEVIPSSEHNEIINIEEEEEELVDNLELVAVITAAIMASMEEEDEVPEDGLVVRSIKRANTKKWQRT